MNCYLKLNHAGKCFVTDCPGQAWLDQLRDAGNGDGSFRQVAKRQSRWTEVELLAIHGPVPLECTPGIGTHTAQDGSHGGFGHLTAFVDGFVAAEPDWWQD